MKLIVPFRSFVNTQRNEVCCIRGMNGRSCWRTELYLRHAASSVSEHQYETQGKTPHSVRDRRNALTFEFDTLRGASVDPAAVSSPDIPSAPRLARFVFRLRINYICVLWYFTRLRLVFFYRRFGIILLVHEAGNYRSSLLKIPERPRSRNFLTHWGRVTQICVFTLQLCKTGDAILRF